MGAGEDSQPPAARLALADAATQPMTSIPARTVGRYELTQKLGSGAMGEVWAAVDTQLDREVAIKLVHPALARHPESAARMLREARAMAKVSHRAVIAIHDAGEADNQLFLAMELVRGTTLAHKFRATRGWRNRLAMVISAGRGLAAAHAAGVLHRDFKPDNVLVDASGRVCVGDFGLATLGGPSAPRSRHTPLPDYPTLMTATGALLGTPAYMSLEQLRGLAIDARADQFSFCVVAYEAVYGERPFPLVEGLSGLSVLDDTLSANAVKSPPPDTQVPAAIRALIVRGLSPHPDERWPSLEALLDELERELRRQPGRKKRVAIILGATAVLAAGAVWFALRHHEPPVIAASQLAPVPLRAELAISPGGKLAIGTDRVEVRDLVSGKNWSTSLQSGNYKRWVKRIALENETTVRWLNTEENAIYRWDFVAGTPPAPEPEMPTGRWIGAAADGDLVKRPGADGMWLIALVKGKRTINAWQLEAPALEVFAISPSGKRFAYVASDRFKGYIVVLDTTTGKIWRSDKIADPTCLAWTSETTLAYGVATRPTISEVSLVGDGFGPPTIVRELSRGFVGGMVVGGSRLIYLSITPATRVRLVDRDPAGVRDLDPTLAAGELGWEPDGMSLTWRPATKGIERRAERDTTPLDAHLDVEPVNATNVGDLAIVALRDTAGRKVLALSKTTGKISWQLPPGFALAARCARDLEEPCFIARRIAGEVVERYEVARLDIATGKTVGQPVYRGPLEDFAVDAGGARIVIGLSGTDALSELDVATGAITQIHTEMSFVRSVAYDPRGGILVAGSGELGTYTLGHTDRTKWTQLHTSDGELLSLVRPSPSGATIMVLGRALSTELWETPKPRN